MTALVLTLLLVLVLPWAIVVAYVEGVRHERRRQEAEPRESFDKAAEDAVRLAREGRRR